MLLWLPPTPSVVGNEVTIGLVSSQLLGDCCFASVTFLWVLAGGTSVAISNVKTMGPTAVVVVVEPSALMAFGRSDASGFGGTVGCLLDGCQCRALLGLRCHCSLELGKLLLDDCDIPCEI